MPRLRSGGEYISRNRSIVIRLEAMLRSEYWNYFRAQFGGVRAFGYNSADSEPIWMKSKALGVQCWGWPW